MSYLYNSLILLFFFIFFSSSLIGYGVVIKKKILKFEFNFGELGILGFLLLYILSVFLNFFIPLNIWITFPIIFFGIILFLLNFNQLKFPKFKILIIIFILSFLSLLTVNLHDDHLLYQIPYIKYKQEYKIIFGLISLNDFLAYSHGFYDIMSLFKMPILENRLVFLLPVIFFMFFIISLTSYLRKDETILKTLIYFIFFLTLLKFTRSKEFGTDIPVIALIFLIQIYLLKFNSTKKLEYFYKMITIFSMAVIFKIYAALAIFYFFIFSKSIKEIIKDFISKQKLVLFFLIFLTLITFTKNLIQSGCLTYPASSTCLDKKIISWSAGKELSEWRQDFLNGGVKGWMPYVRENNYQNKISPQEYKQKFKYNYHQNVFKDPDTERILIVLAILLTTLLLVAFGGKQKINENKLFSISFFVASFLPFFSWFILMPYIRYGGYAYLPFFFLVLFYNFSSYKEKGRYFIIFLVLSAFYFTFKNIKRIKNEIINKDNIFITNNFPIPNFEEYEYEKKKFGGTVVNISEHNFKCGTVPVPCLPGYFENMKLMIKFNYGYMFLKSNEKEQIEILNEKLKIYNLTKDRYKNDFNKKIRYK